MPLPAPQQNYQYSPAVVAKATVDIAVGGMADLTWNSFYRAVYEKAARAIDQQAMELARRGTLSMEDASRLAVTQRNALALELRKPLTPFGRFFSEKVKPAKEMPSFESLVAKKGSYEAVISASSRTRMSVNRVAFAARASGPAFITIDIVLTIAVIEEAPASQRGKVAAQQIGGVAGSVVTARYGGLAGAWAGTTTFALIGSPTLVIPIVGEVTDAGVAAVGGVVGFFLGGLFGWRSGQAVGDKLWTIAPITWKAP